MNYNGKEKLIDEFEEFLNIMGIEPKEDVSRKVSNYIRKEMKFFRINTILSMILIHSVVGVFTISICPQFDVKLFNFQGLLFIFLKFGHHICSILCGFLFLSMSLLAGSLILRRNQKVYLFRIRYYKTISLILLSLFVFKLFGEIPINTRLVFWILGAFLGSLISFKKFKFAKS